MNKKYHIEITQIALKNCFSDIDLKIIITANIHQDKIKNQWNHDHFHFNGRHISDGYQYLATQEAILIESIEKANYINAKKALGRIAHSWQDFFSHSNYVSLWLSRNPGSKPEAIDPNASEINQDSKLMSGISYGLIEYFALVPFIGKYIMHSMPTDSHAWMNLDGPKSGPLFDYAYHAALKKTRNLPGQLLERFSKSKINPSYRKFFINKPN